MPRFDYKKTKLDSIYWYRHAGKKKYAYRYKFYDEFGKRKERSKQNFDTIEQAERALIELKAAILDGKSKQVTHDKLTLTHLNEIYIKSNSKNWRPSSYRNHVYLMDKYILPYIGHYKINRVNNIVIQTKLFNPLLENKFAKGTLLAIYRRLSAVYNFAIQNDLIDKKRFTLLMIKNASEGLERNALDLEVIERILQIARTKYKMTHYVCFSLLFLTGMRIGELRALKWDSIDFDAGFIYIEKTRDRYGHRKTKTDNSVRKFPMSENIRSVLLEYKEWYDVKMLRFAYRNPENFLIVNYAGAPIGENFLLRIINKIKEEENLPYFTPHFFRHTFVSIQLSNNVPIKTVAALIGDSIKTVSQVYAHSFDEEEIEAAKLMDSIIDIQTFKN